MSKKKQAGGPDLFGSVLSTTRNAAVAQTSGAVSGIPDSLAKAVVNLRDVERRLAACAASTGILDAGQAALVASLKAEVARLIAILEAMQAETLQMHLDGIGVAKPSGEMELL